MVVAFILACEVAFWLLLLAGLVARYPLRRRRLGAVLLALTPLTDLVLLVASAADLHGGAVAGSQHGLGAAYLGFSVVFGPSMVRWADVRFAHRFAGGPPPVRPPRRGAARARHEWREFGKAMLAAGIAAALLGGGIRLVGDPARSQALVWWLTRLGVVLLIWAVWPVSYTLQAYLTSAERPADPPDGRRDADRVHSNG